MARFDNSRRIRLEPPRISQAGWYEAESNPSANPYLAALEEMEARKREEEAHFEELASQATGRYILTGLIIAFAIGLGSYFALLDPTVPNAAEMSKHLAFGIGIAIAFCVLISARAYRRSKVNSFTPEGRRTNDIVGSVYMNTLFRAGRRW